MSKKPASLGPLLTQLTAYWQNAHAEATTDQMWYDQDDGVVTMDLPAGVQKHIPSTATQIVDNMSDQLTLDHPTVVMEPKGDERLVQKMISWASIQLKAAHNYGQFDGLERAKKDMLGPGAGVVKLVLYEAGLPPVPKRNEGESVEAFDERFKQYQVEKQACNPYKVVPVPVLSFLPSPGNQYPLAFGLEVLEKTVADMSEYTDWTDPKAAELIARGDHDKASNTSRKVQWVEYWSAPVYNDKGEVTEKGWYIVEVDGQPVLDVENPYGFVPYFYEFSGLGRQDPTGDPKYEMQGLLRKIRAELREEALLKTAMSAQWQYHVFPVLMVRNNAESAAKQLRKGPGKVIEWDKLGDEPPTWLNVPPPSEQMYTFLNTLQTNMTRVSAPVLQGAGGSEYGILEAMRVGNALKVVAPVEQALNRMAAHLLTGMAKLAAMRNLSFKVPVGDGKNVTLNGDDFKRFDFDVSFERDDASENERRMLVGESLHDKGKISFETFHRVFAKFGDPEGEAERILTEKLINRMLEMGLLDQFLMSKIGSGAPAGPGAAGAALAQQLGAGAPAAPVAPIEAGAEALAGTPNAAAERTSAGGTY